MYKFSGRMVLSASEYLSGAVLLRKFAQGQSEPIDVKQSKPSFAETGNSVSAQKEEIDKFSVKEFFKLKRGDVITIEYQNKIRPGVIIKITKDHVYALLLSSDVDSPYKLISGDSRIFGNGAITHTLIPVAKGFAETQFLCQYDNSKLVIQATKAYNKHINEVFAHNIRGAKRRGTPKEKLRIA